MQLVNKHTNYHLLFNEQELELVKQGLSLLSKHLDFINIEGTSSDEHMVDFLIQDLSKAIELKRN